MIVDLLEQCAERLDTRAEPQLASVLDSASRSARNPIPIYNLATLCRRLGHADLWRSALDCAFAMPHDSYQQLYYRGRAKLLLDDWSGWRDLEGRIYDPAAGYLASQSVRALRFNTRAWDGRETLASKSLYVVADGRFSDCLQMLRYIPTLADRAGRLVLSVRPELTSLVRQAYGDLVAVTIQGVEDVSAYDRYAWMMSLPALVGDIPPFAPLTGVSQSQRTSSADRKVDIGLCWSGDSEWIGNVERSLSQDALRSLCEREDVRWISLQTGVAAAAVQGDPRVTTPTNPLFSFAQTAALIARLDAVVTVDTAVAHLAGALGVPTWVLLSADADPRWGIGPTTRWYPSARLVRQRVMGDWADVVAVVEVDFETRAWQAVTV
jgi:hypothetical protein